MRHLHFLLIALLVTAALNVGMPPSSAKAASTITINTLSDNPVTDGNCSLREAIFNANKDDQSFPDCIAGSGTDTIRFSSGLNGIGLLGSPLPILSDTDGIALDGNLAKVTVSGNNAMRVFQVAAGVFATFQNITVTQGVGIGGNFHNAGTLYLQNVSVTKGRGSKGGAIYNNGGTVSIINSTFTGNSAGDGGVLFNQNGTVTITNSTIYANASTGGSIIRNNGVQLLVKNTILANGNGSPLCGGNAVQNASVKNLASDASCGAKFTQQTLAQIALNPLADNGGSTWTFLPRPNSAAFNNADTASCPFNDQRGFARPQVGQCDIGAVELRGALTISATSLSFGDVVAGTPSLPKTVSLTNTGEAKITIGPLTVVGEFAVSANACSVLMPTKTCAIDVIFTPAPIPPGSIGYKSGYLTISNNATYAFTVSLSGYSLLGANLLRNPEFDYPFPPPVAWKNPISPYTLTAVLDCAIFYSYNCSVHFRSNNQAFLIFQPIYRPGDAGDRYLVKLSSKADSIPAGGTYRAELIFQDAANRPVSTVPLYFTIGTHDWEHLSSIGVASADFYTLLFRIVFQKPSGNAWFDDAAVIFLP